jgi:hypothetical protein
MHVPVLGKLSYNSKSAESIFLTDFMVKLQTGKDCPDLREVKLRTHWVKLTQSTVGLGKNDLLKQIIQTNIESAGSIALVGSFAPIHGKDKILVHGNAQSQSIAHMELFAAKIEIIGFIS